MNYATATVAALALVAGFLAGYWLRGFMCARQEHMIQTDDGFKARRRRTFRIMIAALVAVLAVNAVNGFLLIGTRLTIQDRDRCQETYNLRSGLARDERNDASVKVAAAEKVLWRTLRDRIRAGNITSEQLDAAISRYLVEADKLEDVQFDNPYPPPGLCSTRDEEEKAKR